MNRKAFFVLALLCAAPFAAGQQPPGPYPQGVIPPVNDGNGVWRFDRPRGRQPMFFEQLAAMFNLIKPPEPLPFGHSIAFLVGIGPYEHLDALTHTSSDVSNMRNFLLESGGFDTVFEVRDDKVNSVLLNTYMLNYFSRSDPKYVTGRDRFLFYYSGHGGNQGDLGYLLFLKADPKRGDYVTDALDMSAVRRWAYVNVARQVLMILDTCNSGLAIRSMDGNPVGGLGEDPSGILLTAGTGNQQAYQVGGNKKGYGVFTHAILETLRTGMNAQTPFMDVFEVYSRARAAVRDFEIEKGMKMQPDIDHRLSRLHYEHANGNFVFLNPNPVAKNSVPGKRFAGMAVEKIGVGGDLSSPEQLRMARDQFNLLKNSTNVHALRIYTDDYKDLAGARAWVALINARIDELTSSGGYADSSFRDALRSIVAEVPTEFAHYGASGSGWKPAGKWMPAGKLPNSLECTGLSTPSPLVRCTMFRSPDPTSAERRLSEITAQVQAALPGSGWTKKESLDRDLTDDYTSWWGRSVVFKNPSAVTVETQLWKSKEDGHYDVDVVVEGVAHLQHELRRMVAEAASGFANYGAGAGGSGSLSNYSTSGSILRPTSWTRLEKWTPAGNLPDSLECTGTSNPAPMVRCTMFRSQDVAPVERRLTEIIVQVQAALPGLDWTKDESLNGALRDYDADWWQRTVMFKNASAVTVEAQLWRSKKDGHHDVDVVVTGVNLIAPASLTFQSMFALAPTGLADYGGLRGTSVPSSTLPVTVAPPWTLPRSVGNDSIGTTSLDILRGIQPSSTPLGMITDNDPFRKALRRMISEAPTGFAFYGANYGLAGGSSWMPAGNLPDSLECTGTSTIAPLVRCTMFRSPDLALAERRLTEFTAQVQAALPGLDWTKDESLNGALRDYDADWWQRTVVFKNASAVTVEAQLWKSKKDGHHEVDVVVTGAKR